MDDSITKALWVRLEAKKGKESEVENFLRGGLSIVEQEPATIAWFANSTGAIYVWLDAFPDDTERQAHLAGRVAAALKEKASDLFSTSA